MDVKPFTHMQYVVLLEGATKASAFYQLRPDLHYVCRIPNCLRVLKLHAHSTGYINIHLRDKHPEAAHALQQNRASLSFLKSMNKASAKHN